MSCGVISILFSSALALAHPPDLARVEDSTNTQVSTEAEVSVHAQGATPPPPIVVGVGRSDEVLLSEFFNVAPNSNVRRLVKTIEGRQKNVILLHTDTSSEFRTLNAIFQLILNAETVVSDSMSFSRSCAGTVADQIRLRCRRFNENLQKTYWRPFKCVGGTMRECVAPSLTLGEFIHREFRKTELEESRRQLQESNSRNGVRLTVAESLDQIFPPAGARAVIGSLLTVGSAILGVGGYDSIPGVAVGAVVLSDAALQQCSSTYRHFCFHGKYEKRMIQLIIEKLVSELISKDQVIVVTNVNLDHLVKELELLEFMSDLGAPPVQVEMTR